ncbi:hypothetical protein BJ508DRAFT_24498 [Ascobolus immersus RN42]|uniref:Uncharacterized protein n=1 Tax=Ascobolus immersus RN42 TaxID=1160509 RepID=A0A3N4HMU9_ASCIM|nr:hypothetical protein BJ508DRAFT_24498 [Ascobolus immersus RN42]
MSGNTLPEKSPSGKSPSGKSPSGKSPSGNSPSEKAPSEKTPSEKAASDKAPSVELRGGFCPAPELPLTKPEQAVYGQYYSVRRPWEVDMIMDHRDLMPHIRLNIHPSWQSYEEWLHDHAPRRGVLPEWNSACVYCGESVQAFVPLDRYEKKKETAFSLMTMCMGEDKDYWRALFEYEGPDDRLTSLSRVQHHWEELLENVATSRAEWTTLYPELHEMAKCYKRRIEEPNSKPVVLQHFSFCNAEINYPSRDELKDPSLPEFLGHRPESKGKCGGAYHSLCALGQWDKTDNRPHYFCAGPAIIVPLPFNDLSGRERYQRQFVSQAGVGLPKVQRYLDWIFAADDAATQAEDRTSPTPGPESRRVSRQPSERYSPVPTETPRRGPSKSPSLELAE